MSLPLKPDLVKEISSHETKQRYTSYVFDKIYHRYDFITIFLSYGMDKGWKRKLVTMAGLKGSERLLDLACGTGDITFAMAAELATGAAVGLDITHGMLVLAEQKRIRNQTQNVSFERGDIMHLPHPDASFDVVTGGYALRNVPNIVGALQEIKRVLKPGGKFLSLDFGHPKNKLYDWAYLNYLTVIGSTSGLILHGDADMYRYIPETLKLYPGQRGVQELMEQAGFVSTGFHEFMGGIMAINYGTKTR